MPGFETEQTLLSSTNTCFFSLKENGLMNWQTEHFGRNILLNLIKLLRFAMQVLLTVLHFLSTPVLWVIFMHFPHIFIQNGDKICATEETEGLEIKRGEVKKRESGRKIFNSPIACIFRSTVVRNAWNHFQKRCPDSTAIAFLRCLTFCYTEMPFCIWIKLSQWKVTHSWTFSKKHFILDKVICFWSRKLHDYYLNGFTNLDLKIADREYRLFSPTLVSKYLQEKITLAFNDPSRDFSVHW